MSNPHGGAANSLGLTVGATNLAGAGSGQRPVVRPATVTVDRGLVLTGFVDRVGDPVPMVTEDGNRHRPEVLLVEALDGLARSTANTAPVSQVGVTVPAHWRAPMVEALRAALSRKPGLARAALTTDAAAAVTALRANPGLPSSGVIAVCDFGGSGTSITLLDADAQDAPIGDTVRIADFSGDQIDQAMLTKVVAEIFEATDADPSGTAMVGSLRRLRDECRRAKERLSDETATAVIVDLPGVDTTVRVTRTELEQSIAGPLDEFLAALGDSLDRNRVSLADISAVATIGGGARIPLITQRLSEHLRTSVVTTPQPQLTAAEGAALIADRSRYVDTATAISPAAPMTATAAAVAFDTDEPSPTVGALAWSEVEDDPFDAIHFAEHVPGDIDVESRPQVHFADNQWEEAPPPKRRGAVVVFALSAAAAVVAAVVFGLTTLTRDSQTVPAGTESSIAPPPAPAANAPAAEAPAPAPAPVVTTVVSRPQPRVVLRQQPAAPAPAHPAPAAPAPAPAPTPENPAPQNPAPQNPAPETPGTPDPGTGTPPIDPGPGDGGTSTPPIDPGTGGGGTGTPPIDPGTGGGGGTDTGTGGGEMGTGTGTDSATGTDAGAVTGDAAKTP
ncbi:Hsp70 family protein [Mycolicibacterium agri]|uniref:Molecular chaperone n=1 Tax=Mycolicibacterium agri TaxID=36811 RepID=A0A7I9W5S8_MYCAG|nr:Hsp70 family protein [Mycolicibacterium agri]GFG52920.1 hypothetical protein MAGR_43610 [Mycolicibacterium agri]